MLAAQAKRQLDLLARSLGGLVFSSATASTDEFGKAWNRLNLGRMGSQMQWLGRQIEYNFTLPLIAAGAATMTFALQNEKAFTRIEKVYGDAAHGADFYAKELESLKRAFVELSNHFGVAQQDALNIAADWAAAGASGLALAKSVKLTMETMVLGELDAAKATKSLIAIQAQYALSIDELTDAIAVLNMVENQTGASMADLIDGFTRAAGVARSAGVSVEELAADIAALTPATGTAANAGNALKTIFSRLMSPTKEVNDALEYMGIQLNDIGWQGANAQQKLLIMAQAFDDLSDSEKGLVASTIATRYQVNRFEILMAELVNQHGYYARAIQSTTDKTAVFRQAQAELNRVLTSSPQRLKIIWTQLQNAATDVIQPLIPLLLYLATAVKELVNWFSNLDPGVQKFILLTFALLAAVGPVVRYLGALQVLVFELSKVFKFVLGPLFLLKGAFELIEKIPLVKMLTKTGLAVRGLGVSIAAGIFAIPAVFAAFMSRLRGIIVAGIMIITPVWRIFHIALLAITRTNLLQITLIWKAFTLGLAFFLGRAARDIFWAWRGLLGVTVAASTFIGRGLLAIGAAYRAGLAGLQAMLIAFAAWSGIMWKIITTQPLLFMKAMWGAIVALFVRTIPTIRAISTAVWTAMTGPVGIAIGIIIALVVLFWDDLKAMFTNAVSWFRANQQAIAQAFMPLGRAAQAVKEAVMRAFNALPQGIQNALISVVRVVRAAVLKVYELFSYLNPWAKHSPSLVENVTTGVNAILGQYERLSQTGSMFNSIIDDLKLFEDATRRINKSADANRYAEIREDLVRMAADAVGPFDRLIRELDVLEEQLRAIEEVMDAQERVVDDLRDQLDSANDEFEKQSDLLRKMKDEVDNYEDALNRINGDLEVLRGTREALRDAGAGSDILGQYDDQIRALEDQKGAINDQMDSAKRAYEDQKALVEQLKAARDALQQSYDLEKKKLEEIRDRYQEIADRIHDITSAINDFASAVAALKSSGSGGGAFDDVIPADYADVGGSGQLGREGGLGDQSAEIDAFTKELADKTKNMFGLFDFLEPVKKAWGKVKEWLGTNIGPIFSVIGDAIGAVFSKLPNPFEKMNFSGFVDTIKGVLDTIGGFFEDLWELIGPPIMEIKKVIGDALKRAFEEIGPELTKFKDLVGPIGNMFKMIWEVLKPVAAVIGGVLLLAIKVVAEVLANTLGPILNWIIDIVKSVIRIFRGLIEFFVGVFTGDLDLALQGIKDIFGGLWDAIWSTLKNAGLLIWGIVSGLVEGIVGFFTWLWDQLVGHSIIPDIINGIMFWFNFLKGGIQAVTDLIVNAIQWAWLNIIKPIFDFIGQAIQGLKILFGLAIDGIKYAWDQFVGKVQWAWDRIRDHIEFIKGIFNSLRDRFWDIVNSVKSYIDNLVNKFNEMRNRFSFGGMFDGLISAFKSAVNWIIGKWNNLEFRIGGGTIFGQTFPGVTISTPNIPYLAKGDIIDRPTMAMIGEGRQGYPEYVIPTDPAFRKRAMQLFAKLGEDLGFDGEVTSTTSSKTAVATLGGGTKTTTKVYNFYGDLSFPNVRDGNDVEEFIKNLEALMDD